MSAARFIQSLIRRTEQTMQRRAADIAEGGLKYEEYLIACGRYRQEKSQVDQLRSLLKRSHAAADEVEDIDELSEVDEEDSQPAEPTVRRRPRARSWGGR